MRIEGTCAGGESAEKRFFIPGVSIHDKCPTCQTAFEMDLSEEYFQYPLFGKPVDVNGYCRNCSHEWLVGRVIINVTIEDEEAIHKKEK